MRVFLLVSETNGQQIDQIDTLISDKGSYTKELFARDIAVYMNKHKPSKTARKEIIKQIIDQLLDEFNTLN